MNLCWVHTQVLQLPGPRSRGDQKLVVVFRITVISMDNATNRIDQSGLRSIAQHDAICIEIRPFQGRPLAHQEKVLGQRWPVIGCPAFAMN
ncbi:hypothetical protein X748_29760 [Mesorhizobium sp. LNJC386A00]|nr:hypothetical protein X748_29760 [Mesorhizobium sp. LNJC386A00]